MEHIKFAKNYNNKLDQDEFTTIRIYEFAKYQLGHVYEIMLEGQVIFKAVITKITPILDLRSLPEHVIKADSGCNNADELLDLMESFYGDLSDVRWFMLTLNRISENNEDM